jgi:hypothetical protein
MQKRLKLDRDRGESTEGGNFGINIRNVFSGSVSFACCLFCCEAILYLLQPLFGFERGGSVVEVRKTGN